MATRMRWALAAILSCSGACDDDASADATDLAADVSDVAVDTARDAEDGDDDAPGEVDDVAPSSPLGLNDLTFLLPPPARGEASFVPVTELVSQALFERLVTAPADIFTDYERLRVVAVRFDLCDRVVPAPCAADADGSLRIVIQPYFDAEASTPFFEDVAMHAFYAIPNAELPDVIASLRALAALQGEPSDARLGINPALTATRDGDYGAGLRALVRRFAKPEGIERLTCFGQFSTHAALNWLFRGLERRGAGELVSISIPEIAVAQQEVLLVGELSYQVTPLGATPDGFATVIDGPAFDAADGLGKSRALESLAAVDHPLRHTPDTVQCVACHVATTLMADRSTRAAIDPLTVAGRFSAPGLDLTPLGEPDSFGRTLRALGYVGLTPIASQRVVNETANVLGEIEARF